MREVTSLAIGEEPEVGEVYLMRCVDLRHIELPDTPTGGMHNFRNHQHKLVALPIIGTIHTDPEFPGAGGELPHLHIDVRFLTEWEFMNLWDMKPDKALSTSPSFPILPNSHGMEIPTPELHPKMCNYRIGDYRTLTLGGSYKYSDFEDDMEKHTIKLDNPICPHHGTSLAGQPIRQGVITCPTHGLGWCPLTGKLKRKTNRQNQSIYI